VVKLRQELQFVEQRAS